MRFCAEDSREEWAAVHEDPAKKQGETKVIQQRDSICKPINAGFPLMQDKKQEHICLSNSVNYAY